MAVLANLDNYQVFFYAAKYRSITRAALELYMTQPAATRAVQALEAQLDCKLFVRSPSGVTLTAEGEVLYNSLVPAFEIIEDAQKQLERLKALETGAVRVGVNNLSAEWLALRAEKRFRSSFPGIDVMISSMEPLELLNAQASGYLDLSLVMDFDYTPERGITEFDDVMEHSAIDRSFLGLFTDVFLVGAKYASLAKRQVSPQELAELPFIFPVTPSSAADYYLSMLRPDGVRHGVDFPVDGAEHRISLVKRDFGVSCLPAEFVRDDLNAGQLFQLDCGLKMRKVAVYILTNSARPANLAAQKYIALFKAPVVPGR